MTVSLSEFQDGAVIQRDASAGSASVTLIGTYSGSPVSIEYRLLDAADDTTEVTTWATLDAAPAGGAFSGTVTVPQGGWYHAEVRFSNDTQDSSLQTQDWGVGLVIACWGQSNIELWFDRGTTTPSPLLSHFTSSWSKKSSTGNGAISFGNKLVTEFGLPVGLIDSGVSGTQLGGGIEWGSDSAGSTYDDAKQQIVSAGGACEAVLWMQGETDAKIGITESEYATALESLISTRLRGFATNGSAEANLPFFIGQLGRRTDGTDLTTPAIRGALKAVADGAVADAYYAAEMYDLDLSDYVHLTNAAYVTHGERFALAVIGVLGGGTYHRGPQISGANVVDQTTVDVSLAHSGGTDFTPATGITGFEVFDDGALVPVSSAARQDSSTVRLTLSTPVYGFTSVRYMYDSNPSVAGAVKDDTVETLPLEMASGTTDAGTPPGTYNIEWRDVATQTTLQVNGVSNLYYELTGLTADTDYEFRVQETDGSTTSAWSGWFPFSTVAAGSAGQVLNAGQASDSWLVACDSEGHIQSSATANDSNNVIASVAASVLSAAHASDSRGDLAESVGSITGAATGNSTVDALASASAAIRAGAASGESWTVQAQVLVSLVEQGAASGEIRRQTESAVTAALESQSLAADQFIAALDSIASLSDSASVTDAYQAVVLELASIASGAVASDSFRMIFGLQRSIQEAALADASFSISYAFVNTLRSGGLSGDAWALMANLNASLSDVCTVTDLMTVRASTTARLTAGAVASARFAIVNAGVRYLVMGAIILRDALEYRVNTKPALNQSVKIKPGH